MVATTTEHSVPEPLDALIDQARIADIEFEPADQPLTFGPVLTGIGILTLDGEAGGLNAHGEVKLRKVNDHWIVAFEPDFKAKLDAANDKEVAALAAAGLPAEHRG